MMDHVNGDSNLFEDATMPIAIIGMGCRFPGYSNSSENLWDMLKKGRSGWSKGFEGRFQMEAHYHPIADMHGTVRVTHSMA